MTLFWTKTWDALAGAVFPTPCVSCGGLIAAHDPPLCPACWAAFPEMSDDTCVCGAPLPASASAGEATAPRCGRCRRGRSVLSRGAALGFYRGPLRDCVVALKYQGRHKTAERLAIRLWSRERGRAVLSGADMLIGVPLHADRLKERGFNQAALLAGALARISGLPASTALLRTRNTPSQTHLSARDRRRNVARAFAVRDHAALAGATVVLVDDVATTGATLRECAATLLAAGAAEVRAITAARAE